MNSGLLWWLRCLFAGALALLLWPTPGRAGTQDTLSKVRQSGELVVGYYETEIPFSYVDGKGNIVGYSYEITQKIGQAVQKHLHLDKLKLKPQVLTLQNRFAMIQNGTVDLECASSTHTRQRAQSVSFSTSIFIGSIRIMAHKNSGIRDVADLAGKTVVTKSTATAEQIIAKIKQDKKISFKTMVSIDRTTTPLTLLQTGQADAYLLDDALLMGVINEAWRPDDWIVTGQAQSFEAYGCMLKKGDVAFKRVVDQAIMDWMKSGEAEALYQKWFMAPIPPKGRNLQFPLSSLMKNLYTRPNDQPFQ